MCRCRWVASARLGGTDINHVRPASGAIHEPGKAGRPLHWWVGAILVGPDFALGVFQWGDVMKFALVFLVAAVALGGCGTTAMDRASFNDTKVAAEAPQAKTAKAVSEEEDPAFQSQIPSMAVLSLFMAF
jgi:hypothetical protein